LRKTTLTKSLFNKHILKLVEYITDKKSTSPLASKSDSFKLSTVDREQGRHNQGNGSKMPTLRKTQRLRDQGTEKARNNGLAVNIVRTRDKD